MACVYTHLFIFFTYFRDYYPSPLSKYLMPISYCQVHWEEFKYVDGVKCRKKLKCIDKLIWKLTC